MLAQDQEIGGCEVLNSSVDRCTITPILSVPSSEFEVRKMVYSLGIDCSYVSMVSSDYNHYHHCTHTDVEI